ncbi:MAG TPA: hypothetical protein VIR33_12965 [Thermopolyspora sp.]|jgi:hypothetical protein
MISFAGLMVLDGLAATPHPMVVADFTVLPDSITLPDPAVLIDSITTDPAATPRQERSSLCKFLTRCARSRVTLLDRVLMCEVLEVLEVFAAATHTLLKSGE